MKNQLFPFLLAIGIFTLNALPVRAFNSLNAKASNTVIIRGRWCFKFIQVGLLCIDF